MASWFRGDYLEDCVRPIIVKRLMQDDWLCLKLLPKAFFARRVYDTALTTRDLYYVLWSLDIMPRGTKKNANRDSGSTASRDNQWGNIEWSNTSLSDEDISRLSADDSTLQDLAGLLLGLADDGYSVTVKPDVANGSVRTTIIRELTDDSSRTGGLSGNGETVRDSLLCVLFKFDVYMGSNFSSGAFNGRGTKPRFR